MPTPQPGEDASPVRDVPAARRLLFVLVIFGGSFLLFLVQPLVARLALPRLGGAPGVWNSAMLTFQLLLLGGYAYAHAISRLPLRRQAAIHLGLLAIAALTLPLALPDIPPPAPGWEVLWAPALFLVAVGPVFLMLSAQASLMQRWFAAAPGAGNPYRLYAASNFGSFAGLLAYPFWMEPRLALGEQSRVWTIGYLVLIVLVALAAASRWKVADRAALPEPAAAPEPLARRRILLWLALAAVPSGLMLSTTTLLTTDLMAMPLLWVIPLGLYLLSYSVAFSDSGDWAGILTRYLPVPLLLIGGLAMISGGQANPALALAMVALLFVVAVALHGRLYALRPEPARLTFFYLVLAAGGALGGTFTALLAPVLFDWVYEHAILLLAAAMLMPHRPLLSFLGRFWESGKHAGAAAAIAVALAAALVWPLAKAVERGEETPILLFVSGFILLGLLVVGKRRAFAAVFALMMLGHGGLATLQLSAEGARSRSYFGVYAIEHTGAGLRRLVHGTTMHGQQWLDPDRRGEPTAYYGRTSGVGIALAAAEDAESVGIAGLGVGTLSCYRQPGQDWSFYEIDRRVARYSQDGVFSFLADCAPDARIVIGDARLELAREPDGRFDILVIDVFTSDAIPLHLLTAEAFATYRRVLTEDGLLLVHVSNRYLHLEPMVSALAQQGGWSGIMRSDPGDSDAGLSPSDWVALSRGEERLRALERASPLPWEALAPPVARPWTDDHASLVSLFRF